MSDCRESRLVRVPPRWRACCARPRHRRRYDVAVPLRTQRTGRRTHEHHHNERRHDDLLQGLGQRPGRHALARMAVERRYVGRPDDVSRTERLPSRGTRPSWSWPIQPGLVRKRHGRLCRRSRRFDRRTGSQGHHHGGPLDRWRRSRALHRSSRHEACRTGGPARRRPETT